VTGNIANPLGDRVLERLSGLLASSIETVLSTNAGNGRVGASAHAMAGFFSMPTDDTTILFACGPIEIGVLDDAGLAAICPDTTGPHGVEVGQLKLVRVPTTWQSIRGVVTFEREAVERVDVGNTKIIGEEADASAHERELRRRLALESPSFWFERNGASTAKPSSKRFEHAG
jgi:hypothetical protein